MSDAAATIQLLREEFGDKVGATTEFRGEQTVVVQKEVLPDLARQLKKAGYSLLLDLSGVDNFGAEPRFEVVYEFYHLADGVHLRVKTTVSEDDLEVPTLSVIYHTANWHEREAYDMFGIKFAGHPDLRRILMWDDFPYFPLRKDFPLEGKSSDCEQAFTRPVPLEGGPFITRSSVHSPDREPRSTEPSAA